MSDLAELTKLRESANLFRDMPVGDVLRAAADEIAHLRKLTATCTCGTAGLDYEGPQPDCAVCGAVRGVAELQKVNAKLYSENQQLRADHQADIFRLEQWRTDVTAENVKLRADVHHADALLINTKRDRATEHARHSEAYVNVDDGYPWLTCGECDEPLHCIDGGDRLDTLTQAVNGHACAAQQSAEAA